MANKYCKWCNTQRDSKEFYLHPMMADGTLNKCISCCKSYAQKRYERDIKKILEYEKKRNKQPGRRENALFYQRKRRKKYPQKNKARRLVAYYVRSGKLIKCPCRDCGDMKVEAHHPDYSKPLEVVWLCHFHHRLEEGRLHKF